MDEFFQGGVMNHRTDRDRGYWLHLDTLDISAEVAWAADEFPLCLTHMNITQDLLSPYSKTLMESEGRKSSHKNYKLVASHQGLKDQLIALDLLQLLMLGLEIQCVHAVYSFHQSQFLKLFIEKNVSQRVQESHLQAAIKCHLWPINVI